MDELHLNVAHLRDYRDTCLMAFTETWLKDSDPDCSLELNGFGFPIRLDRDPGATQKSQGGGVCLYINQKWCKNVTVRRQVCLPDIELLSVSLRPFYLPREFPQINVTVVYIHPKANPKNATDTISNVIHSLQSLSPEAPNIVLGDFNRCDLKKTLSSFYQYVNCPTRFNKTLDLCYGSIKGAYTSVAGPALGSSDHNTVHLLPVYKTVLRREKVRKHHIKVWSDDASLALQGCFDCTDWSVFTESCRDINELTDVVCSYISFCRGMIIPSKVVHFFPNNKPWSSKALMRLIHERKKAFIEGNILKVREIRKEIRSEIKKAKIKYKDKVEAEMGSNNLRFAWAGMKHMTGHCYSDCNKISLPGFSSDSQLANELNRFYLRFNDNNNSRNTLDFLIESTRAPQLCSLMKEGWEIFLK